MNQGNRNTSYRQTSGNLCEKPKKCVPEETPMNITTLHEEHTEKCDLTKCDLPPVPPVSEIDLSKYLPHLGLFF